MSYPQELLFDAPLAYFRFNEGDGINPISIGSTVIATLGLNQTYVAAIRGALRGDPNRALRLDGSTGYMTFTRFSLTGDQTRESWVRTTSTDNTNGYAGNAALTLMGDSSGSVWDSFGVHGGKARFTRFNNTSWQTFDSTRSVNDGYWHHIACTYNSTTRAVVIYVDGLADGSGTVTAHQAQGGINVIGRGFNAVDYFDGEMDELAFYSSVLPPERMNSHFVVGRRNFWAPRRLSRR